MGRAGYEGGRWRMYEMCVARYEMGEGMSWVELQ